MPDLATAMVADKERFYLTRPDYLHRMLERGSRYLFHIVEEIEKRGMPTELALLPFVESAMNPTALSPAKAAGLWQFIPSTGRHFDLRQDWWVDNRRDVVKSTQAALDYLQRIYTMHGNDWFLALASYNWGEGAVARAIKRNLAAKRPGDYLSLAMPNETRHYVPKLLALKNLILHSDRLGLNLPDLPNRPYFVTLEKTRPIDLQLAARLAGMSVEDFVALNPAHNRPVISASRNNQLKLPADRVEHFKEALASHAADSKSLATWAPLTLKPGDTLDGIASRGGVSVAELRRVNGLRDGAKIIAGTQLLAPAHGDVDEAKIENFVAPRIYEQVERPARYHTVDKRETLVSIAGKYNISTATLAAWNGIKSGVVKGMRLLVQPAGTQTLLTTETGERTVVAQSNPAPVAALQTSAATASLAAVASNTRKLTANQPASTGRGARAGSQRVDAAAAVAGARRPTTAEAAARGARTGAKAQPKATRPAADRQRSRKA